MDNLAQSRHPIPVTLFTGFLGSGKTTLLNRVLAACQGKRIAVIENEFGEVGVDHELVIHADEELFEMNNGCICCTVRGDLIRILGRLRRRRDRFDHVFIETTGLANPGPVLQTFFADDDLRDDFKLYSVITLVDARHYLQDRSALAEVDAQVAFADVILVNKCDLEAEKSLMQVEYRLRQVNSAALVVRCIQAKVDIPSLLYAQSFDLKKLLEREPSWLPEGGEDHHHGHAHGHSHDHHDSCDPNENAVNPMHDSSIGSVGFTREGEMDGERLISWLSALVLGSGADLFRMKGVFALRGDPRKVAIQSVHHVFMNGEQVGEWGEKERHCSLVLIGRHLNRERLCESFNACFE
jgi:G3E family GTPase